MQPGDLPAGEGHISAIRAQVISDRRYQSLEEAVSILQGSSLEGEALKRALAALDILAEAESRVHDVPKSHAHFHEVGALDALADIAGSCEASVSLNADRILSRPISVGGGYVQSAHGLLPVPGPAALEILRAHDIPWMGGRWTMSFSPPPGRHCWRHWWTSSSLASPSSRQREWAMARAVGIWPHPTCCER